MRKNELVFTPDNIIADQIYFIRNKKVMIDRDLADLYEVPTKVLKQAVRRNIERFPDDFMFEMSDEEFRNWRSHFVTSNSDLIGLRYKPFCFTEQGVTMLSCVLNSRRAIEVNIRIIRVFSKMREMLVTDREVLLRLEQLENQVKQNTGDVREIFEILRKLMTLPYKCNESIGFKIKGNS